MAIQEYAGKIRFASRVMRFANDLKALPSRESIARRLCLTLAYGETERAEDLVRPGDGEIKRWHRIPEGDYLGYLASLEHFARADWDQSRLRRLDAQTAQRIGELWQRIRRHDPASLPEMMKGLKETGDIEKWLSHVEDTLRGDAIGGRNYSRIRH